MTTFLAHYLSKNLLYNLLPTLEHKKIEVPLMAPFLELFSGTGGATLTCSCCGWKGSEMKADKHYLVAGAIAELELFCPDCNHYLGFISEPLKDHS
jgi:hypothetical protein